MATHRFASMRRLGAAVASVLLATVIAQAQQSDQAANAAATAQVVRDLKEQVAELKEAIQQLREQSAQYRSETEQLRSEVRRVAAQLPAGAATPPAAAAAESAEAQPATVEQRLARLQDQYDLLSGQVNEQYQTKVESASKYRVRLSGLVLLNLFSNRGAVDSADTPTIAVPNFANINGSFGGTLRQSQVGLEVFGPQWRGARIRGDVQMDFAGGFPSIDNGVTMGILRLRTGSVRLDWAKTSIVAGQEAPFFSPLSPTSLAQLATPALSYSGNLWTWMPQVRVEHRFTAGDQSQFSVQAGILDPLTGEEPSAQFQRVPQAGEASRQPAYATRLAWRSSEQEGATAFGIGGYYSRQNWGFGHMVDGWAATADWAVPLGRIFSLTGELYRGRAIGGLGGALGNTVVYSGAVADPATKLLGLNAAGGWAQLKARLSPTVELNAAAGEDNPFAHPLREGVSGSSSYYGGILRNRSLFSNLIYHPRSDLLFSFEYRHLQSFILNSPSRSADQVNLMMGVLF